MQKNIYFIPDFFNYIFNTVMLKAKRVSYDKTLKINGRIRVYGKGRIEIEKGVRMNSSERSNPIGGAAKTILSSAPNAEIHIGSNVGISNTAIVAREKIVIEHDVRIGGNTKIYDTDFHSLQLEQRVSAHDDDVGCAPVYIKTGAFIGAHCIVLKGVTIGEKSVVGAGSVVTKNIPDRQVWAGNPAKFIRNL